MYEEQGGLCAACQKKEAVVVDHDHSCCPNNRGGCGKCVRALLCNRCNLLAGFFETDPEACESVQAYLLRYSKTNPP